MKGLSLCWNLLTKTMIIRIVKMEFTLETAPLFLEVFHASADQIRSFPGNQGLQLLRESGDSPIFFTYSYWENEDALEDYRHSSLFESTWAKTKILFGGKPQAWSTQAIWTQLQD